jgi:hypothetical protein
MTDAEKQTFVDRFAAAWAAREGDAFLELWHADGLLHYPFANRVIRGEEIGMLNDLTKKNSPHVTWKLIDWTARGNVVVVEWEASNKYGEHVIKWAGWTSSRSGMAKSSRRSSIPTPHPFRPCASAPGSRL